MGSPFKLLLMFAVLAMVAAGILGWFTMATQPRDALGTIPRAVAEEPPPEPPPPPETPVPPAKPPEPATRPTVAPALELPGPKGGTFSLASYRGKAPVILFFFATW